MGTPDFSGRTVLVTGASAGVGRASARAFAAAGAHVVCAARGRERLAAVAAEVGGTAIVADVSHPEDCRRLVEETLAAGGGLDVLVNNAGCHHRGPVAQRSAEELGAMVDANLRAPIVLTRLALDALRASPAGAVVNVASIAGQMPLAGSATYSATKFGLRAFTRALAEELADTGVHVSAVSPGPIATDFILADIDAVSDITFSQTMSTPEQIADLILACAADGRVERSRPVSGRVMATAGYLFPALPRLLRPLLAARGRRAKARYRRAGSEPR
ncbi:SDR family NAD(P)-dependent oxidoreductase [Salinisphaera orenii]|uniref:Short-chain dehydrogenase n=1 Tax=Salinisphaera orenii YIM 95161 TaxID=1051139 RepID=A0A423PHU3_9GAMM|nr:SDR family NAD(P)-dependent oxidoreductase [Salinisphaera halophila]ROO25209.1 short-chain dehydrogenase [Salinisphaera halophila YIM 95161]